MVLFAVKKWLLDSLAGLIQFSPLNDIQLKTQFISFLFFILSFYHFIILYQFILIFIGKLKAGTKVITGAVVDRCLPKQVFLKNLAYFTGKHLCWSNKVAELKVAKFEKFLRTIFFNKTPQEDASVISRELGSISGLTFYVNPLTTTVPLMQKPVK